MTFNVQTLVSSINKSGIAKASHFEAYINGPDIEGLERELVTRVDTCELPGRTMFTSEHRFTGIGPFNKIPYGQSYSDVVATILLSEDLREKYYFEGWQERIMNTGAFDQDTGRFARSRFTNSYFDSYVGTVMIRQYGTAGDLRSVHILNECYPISIAPITVSWNDDTPLKLSITFAYRNYKSLFYRQDQPTAVRINIGPGGISGSFTAPGVGFIGAGGGTGAINATVGGLNNKVAQIRSLL